MQVFKQTLCTTQGSKGTSKMEYFPKQLISFIKVINVYKEKAGKPETPTFVICIAVNCILQ